MAEHEADRREDWTQDWPDEPGNDELTAFAARLRSSRPGLSAEAMARVERRMRRAMARRWRRGRGWGLYLAMAASAAAAAVLAAGIFLHFQAATRSPSPADDDRLADTSRRETRPQGQHPVSDRYEVRIAPLPSPKPKRALLALDENRSLYGSGR